MIAWWQQLHLRQQRLLTAAGAVVIGVLVYVWIWEPLAEAREAERARVAQQEALLGWLEAVAPVAAELRAGGGRGEDLGDRSLLGITDETARAAGLAGALARIEPAGESQVRVWFEGADFVTVMGWLEQFSTSRPVQVSQLQVDRAQRAGQVNVRVTLVMDA